MKTDPDDLSCPVLRKLVCLLEAGRRPEDRQPAAFLRQLAEIELDAVLLGAAPGTRALIQVARDVMTLSQAIATRPARV